jgi:hypothetical protein
MDVRNKLREGVPGKSSHSSLMFVSKVQVYRSEVPFKCSSLEWTTSLEPKHKTTLERAAMDKHSLVTKIRKLRP